MNPVIMPFKNAWDLTHAAAGDVLAQEGLDPAPSLLLINQGSDAPTVMKATRFLSAGCRLWNFDPPLPSLAAVWNRGLQWAWESGAAHCLVVNNDIRLLPDTYSTLLDILQTTGALFVSGYGVTAHEFRELGGEVPIIPLVGNTPPQPFPGPDFSCFLITKECHQKYPFDQGYIPAYCEDLDYHRRLMLGGDGQRIFGINLPFHHVGSGTLKQMSVKERAIWEGQIAQGSRAHHLRKWGGPANEEIYTVPCDPLSSHPDVSTPVLFERVRNGLPALED